MPETTTRVDPPVTDTSTDLRILVGLATIAFSTLYAVSDLMELGQGGFSRAQLVCTYVAEAAIPILVLGLYAVQRPRIGAFCLTGAVLYAYAYVYFSSTVVFALEGSLENWEQLNDQLAPWITLHGAVMVVGGICLGLGTARAGVLPTWIGYALAAAVCTVAVTATAPELVRSASALARTGVFVAFGVATLRTVPGREDGAQRRYGSVDPGSALRAVTK